MAGPYYVNPAHGGSNSGTQANPWTSLQSAADTATAGEIVYCTGTETIGAVIDFDTNSGDDTSGYVKYIGTDASWNNDGTKFCLDATDTYANCILANNMDFIWFENFEFKQATGDGVQGITGNCWHWVFLNCSFHDNGAYGLDAYTKHYYCTCIKCSFYNNATAGLYAAPFSINFCCSFHDNTGDGIQEAYGNGAHFVGCLIYDNGDNGMESLYWSSMINCVCEANTDRGIVLRSATNGWGVIIGCRITNNGAQGIDFQSDVGVYGWNYYEDNDSPTDHFANESISEELNDDGTPTDDEDNADTNEGYTNKGDGTEDFNLVSGASKRRTAITIPVA